MTQFLRKFGAAIILLLCLAIAAKATVPTYAGFTTRSPGYVVQAADWNNEFGNLISFINTTIIYPLNNVSVQLGGILTGDGTSLQVLTNNGTVDNGKFLTLDNTQAYGVKWAAATALAVLTTKGDTLVYSGSANTRLPVGTDGQTLTARSTASNGLGVDWESAAIPSGCIILWSGSIASIPSGYYLCNGQNGTPNLQGLFVVGAGSTSPAATGGMGLLNPSSAPAGDNSYATGTGGAYSPAFSGATGGPSAADALPTGSAYYSVATGSHYHTFSGNTVLFTVTPKYYALCYIMKS